MNTVLRRVTAGLLAYCWICLISGHVLGQGCTAARGCPTIAPLLPGGNSFDSAGDFTAFRDFTQPQPEQLSVPPEELPSAGMQPSVPTPVPAAAQRRGTFLAPGQFILTYQWNYSDADNIWFRDDHVAAMDELVQLVSIQNEHVAAIEMGVAERLSFVYELPFQYNNRALNVAPLSGGALTGRLIQKSGGVADSRAYFRYWLYPEDQYNVSVYAGLKIPTGNAESGDFYQGRFLYDDISIQTGTDSWDPILGFFFYDRYHYFTTFGGFNYRMTPTNQTSALALDPLLADPNSTVLNSVADQYNGDLGFNFSLGQWLNDGGIGSDRIQGLVATFGVVAAAVPKHDLFGGDAGYRRAFSAVYLRPGFQWSLKEDVVLFANVPFTVHRNLLVPGSFPDATLSLGGIYRW